MHKMNETRLNLRENEKFFGRKRKINRKQILYNIERERRSVFFSPGREKNQKKPKRGLNLLSALKRSKQFNPL